MALFSRVPVIYYLVMGITIVGAIDVALHGLYYLLREIGVFSFRGILGTTIL
jgi:hypothetical protein